ITPCMRGPISTNTSSPVTPTIVPRLWRRSSPARLLGLLVALLALPVLAEELDARSTSCRFTPSRAASISWERESFSSGRSELMVRAGGAVCERDQKAYRAYGTRSLSHGFTNHRE